MVFGFKWLQGSNWYFTCHGAISFISLQLIFPLVKFALVFLKGLFVEVSTLLIMWVMRKGDDRC